MTQIQKIKLTANEKRALAKQRREELDALHHKIGDLLAPIFGQYTGPQTVTDELIEVHVSEYQQITFDMLAAISKVFNTRDINVNPYSEEMGGCDSCSFTVTGTKIWISGYKLP